MKTAQFTLAMALVAAAAQAFVAVSSAAAPSKAVAKAENPPQGVGPLDWGQWGGNSKRNNTPEGKDIPVEWTIGSFDLKSGKWNKDEAENVKWVASLGSQSYGNPVVANGKVYVGSNNGAGYLKRYPATIDLGVLLCFDEKTGKFLWQHSNEKLPTGRVHDWPLQGVCAAPLIEGERVWYVSNRGEVLCLDSQGFRDNEDDGPVSNEPAKLFDIARAEDPAMDKVAGIL
jgi:outer membrane protein assembly factor BamB